MFSIAVRSRLVTDPSKQFGITASIVVQNRADMSAVIAQPRQHIYDA